MQKKEYILLGVGAIGAGFLGGLVGAGGGIVLFFVLGALYGKSTKENLILASASVLVFCVISLFFYQGNSTLSIGRLLAVGIPAAAGGITGALLLRRVPQAALKKLFAAVILISGVIMLGK